MKTQSCPLMIIYFLHSCKFRTCHRCGNFSLISLGEKPYACTYEGCNKRFTEYSSLYKHHVVHTQTKPYVCPSCGKHYRQTSTLAMHRRTAHGETDVVLSTATDSDVINGQLIARQSLSPVTVYLSRLQPCSLAVPDRWLQLVWFITMRFYCSLILVDQNKELVGIITSGGNKQVSALT